MSETLINSGVLDATMAAEHLCIINEFESGLTEGVLLYRAICRCGWNSGICASEGDANMAILDHRSQVDGGLLHASQFTGVAPTGVGHLDQGATAAVPVQGSQETVNASQSPDSPPPSMNPTQEIPPPATPRESGDSQSLAPAGASPSALDSSSEGGDAPSTVERARDTLPGPLMGTPAWTDDYQERYMARVYHRQPIVWGVNR